MKKGIRFLGWVLCFCCLLLLMGVKGARAEITVQSNLSGQNFINHNGVQREYYVYQPADLKFPARTMIILHGGGGNAKGLYVEASLRDLAQTYGWLLLFPQGINNSWNSSIYPTAVNGTVTTADDLGFLKQLIGLTVQQGYTESDAVVMTGASRGGLMTTRFACDESLLLAGFGIGIATQNYENPCNPQQNLQAFFLNGTVDPLMPFNGRIDRSRDTEHVVGTLSVAQLISIWTQVNRCQGDPMIHRQEPLNDCHPPSRWAKTTQDITTLELHDYETCSKPIRQFVVYGMGHTWPKGSACLPESPDCNLLRRTYQLDADAAMFEYFDNIGKPAQA